MTQLCLMEYPTIKNALVSLEGWNGEYPALSGSQVIFTCPAGFTDGATEHHATCSETPDTWCTSFLASGARCPKFVYPECRKTAKGKEYIGKMNKTENGNDCLRWDSRPYPTPKDFQSLLSFEEHFLNEDPGSHENYCKNPALRERPWCFISNPDIIWEFCDIPICEDPGEFSLGPVSLPYRIHFTILWESSGYPKITGTESPDNIDM
ncbi:unnamed protein product [Darwinula stevensoni]|uniref:Kringle domain-containing protein n=1 Tax=Darwinula stevensoni TaxID=69355 RepID=A0A7R8XB54_9CRUS|nr:unnamed protein product [Darwinula stevensoni]CAG0886095.1 unnamed protein product [Darwinula stevensoni]